MFPDWLWLVVVIGILILFVLVFGRPIKKHKMATVTHYKRRKSTTRPRRSVTRARKPEKTFLQRLLS